MELAQAMQELNRHEYQEAFPQVASCTAKYRVKQSAKPLSGGQAGKSPQSNSREGLDCSRKAPRPTAISNPPSKKNQYFFQINCI